MGNGYDRGYVIHFWLIPLYMATYAMQTTFVCKLWKLQFGPPDQDPRGMRRGVILQLTARPWIR